MMSDGKQKTRRGFLTSAFRASGAIGLVGAATRALSQNEDDKKIPIALQLYSIREDCDKDLAGCLEAVAKMGYDGVEFAGYYGHSGEELAKLLDENGLKVAGTHIGLDTLLGDELEKSIEFHAAIGNRNLVVPGLAEQYRNSKDAWLKTAEIFNEIAEKLEPHEMRTGYHNHSIEFAPFDDGSIPWDVFFGNTDDDVIMQVDTGNCMHGGGTPLTYLKAYPGRAITVHLKEYSADNDQALLGEGDIPWKEVFEVCSTTGGTEWYIVEQESYAQPPLKCVELCLENLKKLLG